MFCFNNYFAFIINAPNHKLMEDTLMTKFAAFVKEKREALGITQTELAYRVFGSKDRRIYISQIESGKRKGITILFMEKILKELNSDIEFIEY